MDRTGFTPALGFHMLTPLYDRVAATTARERTFKRALLDQAAIEPGRQVQAARGSRQARAAAGRPAAPPSGLT